MKAATATIAVFVTSASLLAASAPKTSSPKTEDDLIIHESSRTVLPSRVGLFQRSKFEKFDKSGRDVGVSYDVDHFVKGDVYIYPVGARGYGRDLPSEFQVQNRAINQLNRKVKLVSRENTQINQGGRPIAGVHASYDLQRDLFADRNLRCGSQLYIFRDGSWFIAYRFSYPQSRSDIALKHVHDFMAQWQWRQIPTHVP